MPEGMNYVAGEWLPGEGNFQAENPTTGRKLGRSFHRATPELATRAAEAAAACAEWFAATSPAARAGFLRRIAEAIEARAEPLTAAAQEETALPEARLHTERARTVGQLRMFADWIVEGSWLGVRIEHADPGRSPLPKPDLRLMNKAIGPVAVFGASNFPLAFSAAGGDTAAALAAGCPVVHKGHPSHPHTCEIVTEAIAEAIEYCDMPRGVYSLLHGDGHEVGAALVRHPQIKAVGFTGSLKGGRALFDLASSRSEPIPFYGELGSINPVFLLPGALTERAEQIAEQWVASLTLGHGQFCTNPGVLVALQGEAWERFAAAAGATLRGAAPGPMLNSRIADSYRAGIDSFGCTSGVTILHKGDTGSGCITSPALFRTDAEHWLASNNLAEEVFGPAGILVTCRDEEELLSIAQHCPGQLTMTLHMTTEDSSLASRLRPTLENRAGRLLVNGFPTGVEVSHAMIHGGPYPACTDARSTSVGTRSIERFLRPVCYQDFPQELLPDALRDDNPLGLRRLVDGAWEPGH